MKCNRYFGPQTTINEEVLLFLFLFSILSATNIVISLISKTDMTLYQVVDFSFFIFVLSGLISFIIYVILRKLGYYDPEAYEIDICDSKIRVRNRDKVWEIDGDNIKKLKIKGKMLMMWPRDYYPFINSSDGLERHNYYVAMEKSLPLLFRLPVLKRNKRERLKEAIEEFKRINGIE